MDELRKVEVFVDGEWKQVRLRDIKIHQSFRLFEPNGDPVMWDGETVFTATDDGTDQGITF